MGNRLTKSNQHAPSSIDRTESRTSRKVSTSASSTRKEGLYFKKQSRTSNQNRMEHREQSSTSDNNRAMNQPIGDVNTDNGAPDISSLPNSPTIIDASNAPSDFQMSSSDRQLDAIDEDSVPTKPSGHFDTCADDIRSLAVQRPVAKEVPSTTPFHALWFPFKSSFRRPSLFGGKDDDSDGDLPIEPLPVESMHTHHSSIVAMNDRKGIAFEECPLPLPEQLWMVPQFGHNSSSMQNLQFMSNLHQR